MSADFSEVWLEATELLKAGSKILRGHYNKPETHIYWEELWEMVLLWMLERNEEADERVEQMRRFGY